MVNIKKKLMQPSTRSTRNKVNKIKPVQHGMDKTSIIGLYILTYFRRKEIWGENIAFLPDLFENEILCGLYARNLAVADACLHLRRNKGYSYRVIYEGLLQ